MARRPSSRLSDSSSAAGFEIYRDPRRKRTSKIVTLGFALVFLAAAGVGGYAYFADEAMIQNVKEQNGLATFSAYILALKGPLPGARQPLLDGLKAESPALRGACARACGKYKQDIMVPLLGQLAIQDPVPTVRVAALDGLIHNGESLGVERYLCQVLEEEEEQEVLVAACETVAKLDLPVQRVFRQLVDLIQDHRGRVAGAAVRTLKTLTGQEWGNDARSWRNWYLQEYGR
ncbi:MAG: HEAT repeat domain-containing protein [Planctomycetota bacterium]